MGYFSRFPNLYYDLNKDKKLQLATDILRRVAFSDRSKESDGIYVNYTVKDGETPEMIADRLYENESMYWVVLMFNEIINVNDEWPMDSFTFERYVGKKYPGTALYFTYDDPAGPFSGCTTQSIDVDITGIHTIQVGDWLYDREKMKWAKIIDVDLDYNRIIISDADAATLCANGVCTVGAKMEVFDSSTDMAASGARANAAEKARIKIHKKSLNKETVHHFVNDKLIELNQWASYDAPIQRGEKDQLLYAGTYDNNVSCSQNQANITPMPIESTPLGAYMELSTGEVSQLLQWKSNQAYEVELNDAKRDIKLMRPEVVADVVVQFEELINR
tara:strand:- start:1861 stop:2856 length:996 start_codon:yes stop_codon:yes gene_type:complete